MIICINVRDALPDAYTGGMPQCVTLETGHVSVIIVANIRDALPLPNFTTAETNRKLKKIKLTH